MPLDSVVIPFGWSARLLLLASMTTASCVRPPIEEIPVGTYNISPAGIPDELNTSAMTVTLTEDTVTFAYTTHDGEDIVVKYEIEPDP